MKRSIVFFVTVLLCFVSSVGVFAEETQLSPNEQAMAEATEFIVNTDNNTITFVSPQSINDENIKVYEKFDDVSLDDWYVQYLSHLVQLGIIVGIDEDTFAPSDYVSRAQFVTMLARASNVDLTPYKGISSFTDIDINKWYAPQVEWAYREGLVQGRENNLFCPNSYITRE